DEFLAMLAHELRNPLAPILHCLRIMETEALSEDGKYVREIAERQVGHMSRLLEDLLDVARITRGQVVLRKESVDLGSIMTRAVEAIRTTAAPNHLQVNLSLSKEKIEIEADPTRLEQIFANLLENAVKYTGAGGSISLIAEIQGQEAVVRVHD